MNSGRGIISLAMSVVNETCYGTSLGKVEGMHRVLMLGKVGVSVLFICNLVLVGNSIIRLYVVSLLVILLLRML
ncbi:unnamed protein product [Camellia sinensis]